MSSQPDEPAQPAQPAQPARPSWLPTKPNWDVSRDRFMSKDISLLESGLFADATVVCNDRTWKVHKIILAARCDWFKAAFQGGFTESTTNTVTITEFTPDVVDVMIRYIYSGVLDITKIAPNESISVFSTYVRIWVVGDFFLFEELKKEAITGLELYCEEKMKITMNLARHPSNLAGIMKKLAEGLDMAYDRYKHALPCQKVLVDFAYTNRLVFFGNPEFSDLVVKHPSFATEVLLGILQGRDCQWSGNKLKGDYRFFNLKDRCGNCNTPSKQATIWIINPRAECGQLFVTGQVPWICVHCVRQLGYPWQNRKDGESAM